LEICPATLPVVAGSHRDFFHDPGILVHRGSGRRNFLAGSARNYLHPVLCSGRLIARGEPTVSFGLRTGHPHAEWNANAPLPDRKSERDPVRFIAGHIG
jgi:hypothetical protein